MKNTMIIILLLSLTSISYSQKKYFVTKDGSGNFSTIAQVNVASLSSGDIIAFKGGERFADARLICKKGVTYTSFGSGQAIIGDSTSALTTNATIQIDVKDVTLDNLKIYGFKDGATVINYSAGNLIIEDCEIVGGQNSHKDWSNGIYQTSATASDISIQRNKIHGFGQAAINYSRPYNYDIGYNEIYDLWREGAKVIQGTAGIARITLTDENKPWDAWDCNYTVKIHHNNIHHFDYMAIQGAYSRMIIEYNEIHDNLDERIYTGGISHGTVGKLWDETHALGILGVIFRYNYVHDLVRRGEVNKTYSPPNKNDYLTGVYTGQITNNTFGKVCYLYCMPPDHQYGNHFGDNWNDIKNVPVYGETPDAVLSGLGYAGYFFHNNIFYNCAGQIVNRGFTTHRDASGNEVNKSDLASYFLNNTLLNCSYLDYVTDGTGVCYTQPSSGSPMVFANNIINLTNLNARLANRFEGIDPYLGYNIYTNQSGYVTTKTGGSFPNPGANKATFVQYLAKSLVPESEYYSVSHTNIWNDTNSTVFVSALGTDGCYIPDVRIKSNGAAHNTGKAFTTLGGSYTMVATYWSQALTLGQDPTGRSFAYDILGNLRTTNDIGAVGAVAGTSSYPQTGLRVILEGGYINGKMKTDLNSSKLLPLNQPYNVSPWNIYGDIILNNTLKTYVDWILVQVRDDLTNTIYSKVAILTDDGTVLNPNGSSFSFSGLSSGEYYLVIKHRNHLGIMSAQKIQITQNKRVDYNFTDSQSKAYGENAMANLGDGKYAMYAGDGDANGVVNVLDFNTIANNILFRFYSLGDVDMNGLINVLDYSFINRNLLKKTNLP